MDARIAINGSDNDRIALWDWLLNERELRGRVRREAISRVGEMGGQIEYVVSAAVSAGAVWATLARTLSVWLLQRRSDVTITITGPGGRKIQVNAKRTKDPEALVRQVLDASAESQ
ncbi:hypothetical protein ACWT_4570 [Actinoplanes sp. SE50]|uniref:effector-associated constant component EACC1 n=1 Tax=unclassified Actinoplanes TaxID=2626549 RepID=UPI00023ED288|nr:MULTISPECIES: hypothetical protein [unclassified Actinoplanes]AEV85592.1 hypothetical protein ACPL_4701 [Actinoplanes sp. SE50/110]ATO83985.1 hypothetical protein ACWT_4570 [Actinoplanes sp. SE50]SLM01395.1 hypothetical protein ACSP50_4631 [Actinoplanes sp. SE50/110]